MVDITFTSEMRMILKSTIGQRLVSLECERLENTRETYGNLLITTDAQRIELINEEEPTAYFGGTEDISRFTCRRMTAGEPFRQFVMGETPMKYPLPGSVTGVSVVDDHISLPEDQYDIRLSMAVVMHTTEGDIAFLRGWHFDEQITVIRDEDYHNVLRPIEQVKSDWAEEGEPITVERCIIAL